MIPLTLRVYVGAEEVSRSVEVHEMSTLDLMKVNRYRAELTAHPVEDKDEQLLRVFFYPQLKYSTSGEVPTIEEFVGMPGSSSNEWYKAVDALNPGALPKPTDGEEPTPAQVEADLEKKD